MEIIKNDFIDDSYLIPPKDIAFPGGGGEERTFRRIGKRLLKILIQYGKLSPDDNVLEVGSGVGCNALPLTNYLNKDKGKYYGFDLVRKRIEWCQNAYKEKHPNFCFTLSDVYNKNYNPKGLYRASEYKFIYQDNYFDFVILNSVFTHMLFNDLRQYLSEIYRVLKVGGKCYITYFLLNQESLHNIMNNKSEFNFRFKLENSLTTDENVPERAIAFYENIICELYKNSNLEIIEPILYGSWSGKKDSVGGQDIIFAKKV